MTHRAGRAGFVPLPPRATFFRRLARSTLISTVVIGFCLGVGVVGYRVFAGLGWVESLLNASMILTGMGPVDPMTTTGRI